MRSHCWRFTSQGGNLVAFRWHRQLQLLQISQLRLLGQWRRQAALNVQFADGGSNP